MSEKTIVDEEFDLGNECEMKVVEKVDELFTVGFHERKLLHVLVLDKVY